MSNAITSTKLEQTENILGQPMLFECMGICVLSSEHESEMRGYIVHVLIVKYSSHRFCLNSATVYKIGRSYRGIWGGVFKTFLEGSVDHIIYRDCKVNRRFFIHCNLASATYHSSPRLLSLRGGWIFLASEDFWRTFDDSFPACAFFLLL